MKRARALALGFAVAASIGVAPRPATADETRECASAYEQTQRQQQKSELLSALEAAERCARPTCPALLRDECVGWATEIRSKLPSLVVRVRGADGCVHADAKVEVTGGSQREPGSDAILLDPGTREIEVVDPVSSASKKQTINFAPGERRDIDVDFATDGAVCGTTPAKKRSRFEVSKVTLALGAVGGGLLLAGGTLGLIGASKRSDLDECKPSCSQDRIDAVRPFFLAGDVLAGFGVLVLGAAVVTFFSADSKPAATARSSLVVGAQGIGASF